MSKLSIYEQGWLNLVFEGKNQAYGAYQLRRENPKTTLLAFLSGLLLVGFMGGLGLVLSSFGTKTAVIPTPEVLDESLHVTTYVLPEPPPPAALPVKTTTAVVEITEPVLRNPVLVRREEVVDIIPENKTAATVVESSGTVEGTATPGNASGGTGAAVTPAIATPNADLNKPLGTAALDKLPEYPGGIGKFYQYVANNFEKPEVNTTVQVLVSFVIERDGSMTDLRVLRNPGYGLDKEALRVLKSLKIKWAPGMKDGKAVRTQYTLPIKVTPNS